EIRGEFLEDCRLHACSADKALQCVLYSSGFATRPHFSKPLELKLKPARIQVVTVRAGGEPVEGAHVVFPGDCSKIEGVTGFDGPARLMIPSEEQPKFFVAWHPRRGVAGRIEFPNELPHDPIDVALAAPAVHTIKVLDPDGKPAPDVRLRLEATLDGGV